MQKSLFILGLLILVFLAPEETGAEPVNRQVSSFSFQLQNEEQVFYHPEADNIIVANWRDFRLGYRQIGIGRSIDGGATWTDFLNPLQMNPFESRQSDPTLTIGPNGEFIMSVLDYIPALQYIDSSFVAFIISEDSGATWSGPYPCAESGPWFEDKQFITTDRTGGPHSGNVYVGWARFPNPTRIIFARSNDGGYTWDDTLTVGPAQNHPPCGSPIDAGQFTQPIVGADGSVYVFWSGFYLFPDECAGYRALKMSKSTDGGQSFSIIGEPVFQWNSVSEVDGGVDVYNASAGDCDISGGPYHGTIYISSTNGIAPGEFETDVILIKSTDGGATWSEPTIINDDPPGNDVDQFHPWLIVNQDGVVCVIFYDQRTDPPAYYDFDAFVSFSFDGGETFTTNYRVSDVSISPDLAVPDKIIDPEFQLEADPQAGGFDEKGIYHAYQPQAGLFAEYIGITSNHDSVTCVWTDTRNNNQDVFGASFEIPFLEPRLYNYTDGGFTNGNDSLHWSTCWHAGDVIYEVEIDVNDLFTSPTLIPGLFGNKLAFADAGPLTEGTPLYWRVRAIRGIDQDTTAYSATGMFEVDMTAPPPVTLFEPTDDAIINTPMPTFAFGYLLKQAPGPFFELEIAGDSDFTGVPPYFVYDGIECTTLTTATFMMPDSVDENVEHFWRVTAYDGAGNRSASSELYSFIYVPYICGDTNEDNDITIGDVLCLIGYVFGVNPCEPNLNASDVNNDGSVNVGDAIFLINYIFKDGPPPSC